MTPVTLAERIAARILSHKRLRGVPAPVVEEVLARGFEVLADAVPMSTPASEIVDINFEACEACGHLIDPSEPEGAVYGSEDAIWLCNACVVEEAAAPSPGKGGG